MEERMEQFIKGPLEHMGSDAVPHAVKTEEDTYQVDLRARTWHAHWPPGRYPGRHSAFDQLHLLNRRDQAPGSVSTRELLRQAGGVVSVWRPSVAAKW